MFSAHVEERRRRESEVDTVELRTKKSKKVLVLCATIPDQNTSVLLMTLLCQCKGVPGEEVKGSE